MPPPLLFRLQVPAVAVCTAEATSLISAMLAVASVTGRSVPLGSTEPMPALPGTAPFPVFFSCSSEEGHVFWFLPIVLPRAQFLAVVLRARC